MLDAKYMYIAKGKIIQQASNLLVTISYPVFSHGVQSPNILFTTKGVLLQRLLQKHTMH